MGGKLSAGAIVGIVFGCIGFLALLAGCVFLKTVLDHRRRVRRAVNAAAANTEAAPAGTALRNFRSRYPEAIPCDNYEDLFPDEEPAKGNVVFQSRADIDRMRDVLVRIEDAGDDRSSEDFSTTEMVSVNNSFARGGHSGQHLHPGVHAGQIVREKFKPDPSLIPNKMGSFDNEHNVAMSFVSAYPTPASSMPAFAATARSRGGGMPSASFNPAATMGSYAASFGAPPSARADGSVAAQPAAVMTNTNNNNTHFQDRNRGGLRLLVPVQDRGHFGDGGAKSNDRSYRDDNTPMKNNNNNNGVVRTPLSEDCSEGSQREGREGFGGGPTTQSYNPGRHVVQRDGRDPFAPDASLPAAAASFQSRWDANAASFNNHLSPSFSGTEGSPDTRRRPSTKLRPPALPLGQIGQPTTNVPASLPVGYGMSTIGGAGPAAAAAAAQPPRSGLLGATRHDPLNLHHTLVPTSAAHPPKKHRVRIHRQHRVRKVDKGGYVVLEETDSSEEELEGEQNNNNNNNSNGSPTSGAPPASPQSPAPASAAGASPVNSTPSPANTNPSSPNTSGAPGTTPAAAAAAKAKAKEQKKKRYYFQKLSSLDVYGHGQYLPGAAGGGYPPVEPEGSNSSSGNSSEGEVEVGSDGQVLGAAQHYLQAPTYASNSSRKPT